MVRVNPFKPTAGMNPPELIGRDEILDDFTERLKTAPELLTDYFAFPGSVAWVRPCSLTHLETSRASMGSMWLTSPRTRAFCDRILGALSRNREVSSLSISPSILGVSLGPVEISKSATQLGEAMYEASRNGGLLVTLDEVQDAPLDEMRELGNEIQLLVRQGANVAFAFAGLPASVDGVVVDETLTFLQRAKHVELKRLMDFEVGDSFEDTMVRAGKSVATGVSDVLTAAAAGYPFMVQLVGYYTWQSASRRGSDAIELRDAQKGHRDGAQNFDNMVIEPALRRVSGKQFEYLAAMARCGSGPVASGDIAREMGGRPHVREHLSWPPRRCGAHRGSVVRCG